MTSDATHRFWPDLTLLLVEGNSIGSGKVGNAATFCVNEATFFIPRYSAHWAESHSFSLSLTFKDILLAITSPSLSTLIVICVISSPLIVIIY